MAGPSRFAANSAGKTVEKDSPTPVIPMWREQLFYGRSLLRLELGAAFVDKRAHAFSGCFGST